MYDPYNGYALKWYLVIQKHTIINTFFTWILLYREYKQTDRRRKKYERDVLIKWEYLSKVSNMNKEKCMKQTIKTKRVYLNVLL